MHVLEERRITSRDITELTMILISTSQMTERANVINIIAISVQAPSQECHRHFDEGRTCSNRPSHGALRKRGRPRRDRY